MPQMAPMWWFSLFMIFIISYFMFMMMIYFHNIYNKKKTESMSMFIKNIEWKW